MNSVNFKTVKNFTRGFLFALFYFLQIKVHAIEAPKSLVAKPAQLAEKQSTDEEILLAIKKAVQPTEPTKEIVILNTESGFIPDKVRVKKGEAYKVHIVNLNMKEKNISFLMDSFTQSHNTLFGVRKSFNIEPQVEGIFSYQCPETGIQGQMIVTQEAEKRLPASEQ
ncbi:MAG: cupredoxin domain-containing protein [Bdellovibrionaceae bacterium]|nr:cupredoxin domain-containing protein [Bdellovibrio sp.]